MRGHIDQMPPPPLKDELRISPPVKIKVHFHEDIFVIQVPRTTEYSELVDKVGKKIRLCGPRRDDGPLRVKYKDEDGDLVSLGRRRTCRWHSSRSGLATRSRSTCNELTVSQLSLHTVLRHINLTSACLRIVSCSLHPPSVAAATHTITIAII